MRIDVAIHELRLMKSRSQAQSAVQNGHVLLNGERVKASREVKPGDRLTFVHDVHAPRTVEVLELPTRSLSKEAAKALVREVGAD
jgi:ribosome-associated heat shock protein Hsp15